MEIFGELLEPISAPICFGILIITLVLFATERFKSGIVAIASSVVMVLCGFITPAEFTGGFSNTVTIFFLGITVMGTAIVENGCAEFIGKKILSVVKLDERGSICFLFMLIAVLSVFLNNLPCGVLGIYLSIAVCQSSGGKFRPRYFIMPMGIAAACGGSVSMIGSTTQLAVAGLLPDMGLEMHMWDLAKPGLIIPIIFLLWYYFFGYNLMVKTFDFPELEEVKSIHSNTSKAFNPKSFKGWLPAIILAGSITLTICGWNFAVVAMIGMCIAIMTGCISFKKAIVAIDWNIFFLFAGGIGIATGFKNAGTAEMIANWVVGILGSAPRIVYLVIFTILAAAITNIMPNIATALVMTPIAAAVATNIGISVYPMILCVIWGASLPFSTPIGASTISITMMGGYRFKDYTVINIIPNIIAAIALPLLTPIFWPL